MTADLLLAELDARGGWPLVRCEKVADLCGGLRCAGGRVE